MMVWSCAVQKDSPRTKQPLHCNGFLMKEETEVDHALSDKTALGDTANLWTRHGKTSVSEQREEKEIDKNVETELPD